MKKAKASRVPILGDAFEVNLPKLMRMAKAGGESRLVLDNGDVRTVAVLAETRLAVFLGGRAWIAEIVAVQCLQGRVRPLLQCPRAHEGNFQSLYYRNGELACRHCHRLRYISNLAPTQQERRRIAYFKLLQSMTSSQDKQMPVRPHRIWRKSFYKKLTRLNSLSSGYYRDLLTAMRGEPRP